MEWAREGISGAYRFTPAKFYRREYKIIDMIHHSAGRPQLAFSVVPMQASHLTDISSWSGIEYTGGGVHSYVMTMNQHPVFCIQLMRIGGEEGNTGGVQRQLHLLFSPHIRQNGRLLLLAWQAASTFVFLRLNLSRVRVTVEADCGEENEVLRTLGYRLIEARHRLGGSRHVYDCTRESFCVVM